uniref:OSJNBb0108J11.14 protein n=1 Tax=Oryza sativa subsp. japonica TaxID=39947 RepID=Q7XQX8_ORYSJ|nr:OSJNBb0108J11.14 [Oryza sativa Japonica Group]
MAKDRMPERVFNSEP